MSFVQQYWFGYGVKYNNWHDISSLLGEFDFRRMDLVVSGKVDFLNLMIWYTACSLFRVYFVPLTLFRVPSIRQSVSVFCQATLAVRRTSRVSFKDGE
jgi:hypothetical protein